MTGKPVVNQNEFIEIGRKQYFVAKINDNEQLIEMMKDTIDYENDDDFDYVYSIGTWYSCIDSRGKHVTIFDPSNSADFSVVRFGWMGEYSRYNTISERVHEWLYAFFHDIADRIKFFFTYRWARKSGFI